MTARPKPRVSDLIKRMADHVRRNRKCGCSELCDAARAELAAMRPVVEAAEEWISNPGFDYTQRLIKAIRTYERGQK